MTTQLLLNTMAIGWAWPLCFSVIAFVFWEGKVLVTTFSCNSRDGRYPALGWSLKYSRSCSHHICWITAGTGLKIPPGARSRERETMSEAEDRQIEQWKVKRLVKMLDAARGNGTSAITLILNAKQDMVLKTTGCF